MHPLLPARRWPVRGGIAALLAIVAGLVLMSGCGVNGKQGAGQTARSSTSTTSTSTSSTTTSVPPGTTVPEVRGWVLVTDQQTGLSFRLPEKPRVLSPPVTAPNGKKVNVRGYQVLVDKNLLVQVSVYDLDGRSFDADKAIDGVAKASGGTVVARKHTPAGALDIVDARIRIPKGQALGYDRVFKIGDHAVQLWTLGLASDEARIRSMQERLSSTFRSD
jgi:hypothetical protein